MHTDTAKALPPQSVLLMVAAGTMLAAPHHRTDPEDDHPAVSYLSQLQEQRSQYTPVSGFTEHMSTPTTSITASTTVPTPRSLKVRTKPFLSLVCARCTTPVDVTTIRTRPIWIRS